MSIEREHGTSIASPYLLFAMRPEELSIQPWLTYVVADMDLTVRPFGVQAWPRWMRRAHKRLLKEAAVVSRRTDTSAITERKLLARAVDSSPLSYGDLAPVHQLLGLFDGIEALTNGDHHEFLMGAVPLIAHRWVAEGHHEKIHTDALISNAFHLLGEQYARLGSWSLASNFFFYSAATSNRRRQERFDGELAVVTAFMSDDEELISTFSGIAEETAPSRWYADLLRLLQRAHTGNPAEIEAAIEEFASVAEARWKYVAGLGFLLEYLFRKANQASLYDVVQNSSRYWMSRLSDAIPHELIGVRQQLACAMQYLDLETAQTEADAVVQQARLLETCGCDDDIWVGLRGRYAVAREVRLHSALARRDLDAMERYLLEDHIVGSTATTVEVDQDHDRQEQDDASTASSHLNDRIPDPDEAPTESAIKSHVPAALLRSWEDLLNSVTVVEISDGEGEVDGLLWLLAQHGQSIFWTLAENGIVISAGEIRLADEEQLRQALHRFRVLYTPHYAEQDPSAWLNESLESDIAIADSFEEIQISAALGRLVPPFLRQLLYEQADGERPELIIGLGYGLPPIPWPLVNLIGRAGDSRRLIELANLRFWLSGRVQSAKVANRNDRDNSPYPLLSLVDSLDPSGLLVHEELAATAKVTITWRSRVSGQAGRENLEAVHSRNPRGVFFYRGHLDHEVQGAPASASIRIPGANGTGEDLYSGQLFGRYDSGSRWFPMPTRVVLSCCSSASSLLRSEALNFAAASIVGGGAEEVVATAIDVDDTPFTEAFEERLARAACRPVPLPIALADLQREMLSEWRLYSVRGGMADKDAALDGPDPMVWAMYRCY